MKLIISSVLALSLAACATSIEVYKRELPKEERNKLFNQDIERAEQFVGQGHIRGCLDVFKFRMHDPDSFEVAQYPVLDRESSRYTWGVSWVEGQPFRLVVFSGAVRGNNAFGGKVLTNIQCEFNISDTEAKFYQVKQR
ncbi:MAG: hypothetical protein AB3N28_10580 [Kordiimonas sp.]